jgi:hypothetical protein
MGGSPPPHDVEKQTQVSEAQCASRDSGFFSFLRVKQGEVYEIDAEKNPTWYQKLLDAGAEENGIKPVPLSQRTNTHYDNMFTMFFTCLLCLLP